MNKNELETNPLPSYIFIDGFEQYVTYKGQRFMCRLCGETGHLQMNCEISQNSVIHFTIKKQIS